ncbi:MAG: SDR family NAD(P)-dependent oxidoreductase [Candidatus Binatia bacterium]
MADPQNVETALVTGASSGIGLEFARLLAEDGYSLVLVARREERLRELAAELGGQSGVPARVIARDLAVAGAARAVFDELQSNGVEVDVLVNNAGFGFVGDFTELELRGQLDMVQVNVTALTELTHLFARTMVSRGEGAVLNVASTAAFQAGPTMAVYYATKAYVLSFSEALADELRGTGVSVTALCPGPVETGFQATAKVENARLFKFAGMMDARTVAKAGYAAMKKGRTIVVPGLQNWLGTQAPRVLPRAMIRALVRYLQAEA